MRRLAGRDAQLLYEEHMGQPMHAIKVLELEDGVTAAALREAVRARVAASGALRGVPVRVPFHLGHPAWVDAGEPDLDVHVRSVTAPALWPAVSRIAGPPLRRDIPLWELWLVNAADRPGSSVVFKVHHAIADGEASVALLDWLFGAAVAAPDAPAPAPRPSRARLAMASLAPLIRLVGRAPRIAARVRRANAAAHHVRMDAGVALAPPYAAPALPWNRPLGLARELSAVSADRASLDRVRTAAGATVGEAAIAVVAGALRSHLMSAGLLPDSPLTAVVPHSTRTGGSEPLTGNRNAAVFVTLPTDRAMADERLAATSSVLRGIRAHRAELDLAAWEDIWELYPAMRAAYRAGLLVGRIRRRPTFSLIVSVVRGPAPPLDVAGVPVRELHSVGPLSGDLGLNVTVWTYGDRVSFAVQTCPGFVPELPGLLARIAAEIAASADY